MDLRLEKTPTSRHKSLFWLLGIAAVLAAIVLALQGGSEPRLPSDPKAAAFQEVNARLDAPAATSGNDDAARALASKVHQRLTTSRGIQGPDLKVAVESGRVGKRRRVVLLVRMDLWANEAPSNRKMVLEAVADVASEGLADEDHVVIGLRGPTFYSAIADGIAEGTREEHVGSTLDTAPLQAAIFELRAAAK